MRKYRSVDFPAESDFACADKSDSILLVSATKTVEVRPATKTPSAWFCLLSKSQVKDLSAYMLGATAATPGYR